MADVAVTTAERPTLVLRFADLGIALYGALRVVGEPARTVTWVVEEPLLLAALRELDTALPEPSPDETARDAIARAVRDGAFAQPGSELVLAYRLGVLLLAPAAWQLLLDCASDPRAVLFVAPSARLARVPWGLLALPAIRPAPEELARARMAAFTESGPVAAQIPWPEQDMGQCTQGYRLMELVDVLAAVPASVVHAPRAEGAVRDGGPPLLVLDPRVPGQLPDSPLGSVLGRPSADTAVARHFAALLARGPVLPDVESVAALFRRPDAGRMWLADMLARGPGRMVFVGHCSAADPGGSADRAALHLADETPVTAADLMAAALAFPSRVALLACASGGDYRFDEATGLVAALILGGARLVTATLWALPTTAGYRAYAAESGTVDPMAELIAAVDDAHGEADAGRAVNRWQRAQMRRWRDGNVSASPLYWAALVSFAVDGAR